MAILPQTPSAVTKLLQLEIKNNTDYKQKKVFHLVLKYFTFEVFLHSILSYKILLSDWSNI